MTFDEYAQLDEEQQSQVFQALDAYSMKTPPLAQAIINALLAANPELGPIENINFCLGRGLGPYNVISVKTRKGDGKRVPKEFMGALVRRNNEA